jgi:hypothetical protein
LKHWKKFFAEHKTYFKVGTVMHVPINPMDPIPPPCKSPKSGDGNPAAVQDQKQGEAKEGSKSAPRRGGTTRDAVREDL